MKPITSVQIDSLHEASIAAICIQRQRLHAESICIGSFGCCRTASSLFLVILFSRCWLGTTPAAPGFRNKDGSVVIFQIRSCSRQSSLCEGFPLITDAAFAERRARLALAAPKALWWIVLEMMPTARGAASSTSDGRQRQALDRNKSVPSRLANRA
jgi:hypothetical protein